MPSQTRIPRYDELLWPTVQALRELDGSGAIDEIVERVARLERFDEELQAVPHVRGSRSEIEYRLAWARTHLKAIGLATNSERGVWSLTDDGRHITEKETRDLNAKYVGELRARRRARKRQEPAALEGAPDDPADDEASWQDLLLEKLIGLQPDQFERLSQRLLREAGFVNTKVLGRSGDGGIDGLGVYRLSLVSFPVFFQCKKYRGSVGPRAVRDFRGAMQGRGDKGLLITTGSFTSEARQEATREGATPIDLIDGDRLTMLLKDFRLGVTCSVREDVEIHPSFFEEL